MQTPVLRAPGLAILLPRAVEQARETHAHRSLCEGSTLVQSWLVTSYVRVRFDWAHQRNGSKNIGFPDFPDFRKMLIWGIFPWDLGSGRVRNRLEMAVGFK